MSELKLRPSKLETDIRAKGDAQIVMSAAGEIDLVADVETQAYGAEVSFKTTTGIKDTGEVAGAEILDGTDSVADGGRTGVEEEVVEPAFDCEKGMEAVMAEFEFWPEEAVEHAQIGIRESNRRWNGGVVGEAFGKNLVEVVTHFSFQ